MRHLLKLWLLCLLSLALPIQGAAAASMLSCGQAAHHEHAAHAHSADADHELAADSDQAPKAKCSACASCCTAAALPSAVLNFEHAPEHGQFMVATGSSPPSFLTSGPERPPRSFLA